jgi:hypothetical protein
VNFHVSQPGTICSAVLEGEVTDAQKLSLAKMELSNSMLDVCAPQHWPLLRECRHADIEDMLATGGVLLPGSVKKIVAVRIYLHLRRAESLKVQLLAVVGCQTWTLLHVLSPAYNSCTTAGWFRSVRPDV